MAFPWAAAATVGGSLISGLFGKSSQDAQNDYIKKYNKNKIQWTVADAKKAGIHPLAALGSSTAGSFAAPIGGSPLGDAVGDGLSAAGASLQKDPEAPLRQDVLRSEAERNRAEAAALLADATSRTTISNARSQAIDIPTEVHLGALGSIPKAPKSLDLDAIRENYGDDTEGTVGGFNAANEWAKKYTGLPLIGDAEWEALKWLRGILGEKQ